MPLINSSRNSENGCAGVERARDQHIIVFRYRMRHDLGRQRA